MSEESLKVAPWPKVDFGEFGEFERRPLSRIQAITGLYMSRNWAMIPHVTHHDEADVTALEAYRKSFSEQAGVKVTALSFIIKACAKALLEFPKFNASLEVEENTVVYKKYVNIGFATDTPNGLLVPVVRNCDAKDVVSIAQEVSALAEQARTKGLPMAAMSGGCFSVSSLGPEGGLGFTPIINAPEVAILGVSRLVERPIKAPDGGVAWATMIPLSLSYDHRAINGADASRFMTRLRALLASPEGLTLDSEPLVT